MCKLKAPSRIKLKKGQKEDGKEMKKSNCKLLLPPANPSAKVEGIFGIAGVFLFLSNFLRNSEVS